MNPTETDFESQVSMETEAIALPDDPPFRILLLGDYSGRVNLANSSDSVIPESKPIAIDRDNFEDVMKKLNVSLRLRLTGESGHNLQLSFRELDDFHPDRIFEQLEVFSDLRDLRKRLLDENRFDEAAKEVRSWLAPDSEAGSEVPEKEKEVSQPKKPLPTGSLLDDILGHAKTDATAYAAELREKTPLGDLIRQVVKPHLVQTDEAEQSKMLGLVDSSTSDLMAKILHHPEFKALEAAWRGVYFVVRKAETGSELKISLLDISKPELEDDLAQVDELTDSRFFKILVTDATQTLGGEPWSVVCGNYDFSLDVTDAAMLIRIAKLGSVANAPFISHIRPQMLGVDSIAENPGETKWNYKDETPAGKLWTTLRTFPEAASLGLAIPRFLARLPYGENTDPTEVFAFEEFTDDWRHENYVWLNPSFACAVLLAQSFSEFGWEMGRHLYQDLEGFPVHLYPDGDEIKTKPCAEVVLTHDGCDILLDQGLMPLISYRDTDRIRLGRFQSVAFPPKALKGRWN